LTLGVAGGPGSRTCQPRGAAAQLQSSAGDCTLSGVPRSYRERCSLETIPRIGRLNYNRLRQSGFNEHRLHRLVETTLVRVRIRTGSMSLVVSGSSMKAIPKRHWLKCTSSRRTDGRGWPRCFGARVILDQAWYRGTMVSSSLAAPTKNRILTAPNSCGMMWHQTAGPSSMLAEGSECS